MLTFSIRTTALRRSALAASVILLSFATPAMADTTDADPNATPPTVSTLDCGGDVQAVTITPAAGFDPLTATDDELDDNGYPTRPDDDADLPAWEADVAATHAATACPKSSADHTTGGASITTTGTSVSSDITAADPDTDTDVDDTATSPSDTGDDASSSPDSNVTASEHSANWDGNVVTGHTYTYAKARWKVPKVFLPGTDKSYYSSSWVGIGAGNSASHPLVQAGMEADGHSNLSHYSLWWEVFPQNSEQVISTDITFGDSVWVSVTFTANYARFNIQDETSHAGGVYYYRHGTFSPDGTAEWIYERPTVGGYLPYLADAPVTFTDTYAKYGSTQKPLGSLSHYYDTMWNCTTASNTELAYAGGINSAGTAFATHFKNYGARSKASTCYSH